MLQNYAMAASLAGFVVWVWYYSMTAVGGKSGNGGMEQLISEAESAKEAKERKSVAEKEVDELLQTEMNLGKMDSSDEAMGGKGLEVVVAVAAPEEIANREEKRNLEVANANGGKAKPLWKKVVFFWRK